ncbi:hypothetical protein [Melghirimyces algeriensis]|uniref:Uncharacterized protein n=1 Tax=Melghirimyces algeriensis TaxID=910412 RepID=A0A521ERG5_9BACL|nr:hypothetical protein [Melghirimyces algeriensis]SMO85690.1 hypothetical protein SAMN06264849_11041 [Melghirimyces algeriensis]
MKDKKPRLLTKAIRGGFPAEHPFPAIQQKEADSFHFFLLEKRDAETDITPSHFFMNLKPDLPAKVFNWKYLHFDGFEGESVGRCG